MLSINCKGRLIHFDIPKVMGIINATPDSFYHKSRFGTTDAALGVAEQMLEDGASFLDIGGQSTRPGSSRITAEEELARVVPVVEAIAKRFPDALMSIDTYYSTVAIAAITAGAALVNDVSAGTIDGEMLPAVASLGVPYVLMHMQGNLQNMQAAPQYKNVVLEVYDQLNFRCAALIKSGIKDIIIDPGFGFGKTISHNFQLLEGLDFFNNLNKPLMIGLSRKGTVYKSLNITADEAGNGTSVLHTVGLLKGAQILRVHDVKEAVQAVKLIQLLNGSREAV